MDIHLRNFESMPICKVKAISNLYGMILPFLFARYAAFAIGISAAFSIFSINIPYPVVGSLINT